MWYVVLYVAYHNHNSIPCHTLSWHAIYTTTQCQQQKPLEFYSSTTTVPKAYISQRASHTIPYHKYNLPYHIYNIYTIPYMYYIYHIIQIPHKPTISCWVVPCSAKRISAGGQAISTQYPSVFILLPEYQHVSNLSISTPTIKAVQMHFHNQKRSYVMKY